MAKRWRETPEQTWPVTQAELDEWRAMLQEPDADELQALYTMPAPDGDGWRGWIAERWPTALGTR